MGTGGLATWLRDQRRRTRQEGNPRTEFFCVSEAELPNHFAALDTGRFSACHGILSHRRPVKVSYFSRLEPKEESMAGDRPKIPKNVETELLLKSRRRCALCFGLRGDRLEKPGQIAHLDQDRSNNVIGNLCWLCL